MKSLSKPFGHAVSLIFAIALFVFSVSLTYKFAVRVFPGDYFMQILTLIIFDFATLAWWILFNAIARGNAQRIISAGLFVVDLLGVGCVIAAEIMTGQALGIAVPDYLLPYAAGVTIVLAFLNTAAIYFFHALSVDNLERMSQQAAEDKINALALEKLDSQVDLIAAQVADSLAADMLSSALLNLSKNNVIDTVPVPGPVGTISKNGQRETV